MSKYGEIVENDAELKPCPFCGGEARIHASHDGDAHYYQVDCSNEYDCGAWPAVHVYHTEAEAIAAWNTRAERTCKVDRVEFYPKLGGVVVTWFDCGHAGRGTKDWFNYCPECGAKVVE